MAISACVLFGVQMSIRSMSLRSTQLAPVGFDGFIAPVVGERLRLVGAAAQTALSTGRYCRSKKWLTLAIGVGMGPAHEAVADHADVERFGHVGESSGVTHVCFESRRRSGRRPPSPRGAEQIAGVVRVPAPVLVVGRQHAHGHDAAGRVDQAGVGARIAGGAVLVGHRHTRRQQTLELVFVIVLRRWLSMVCLNTGRLRSPSCNSSSNPTISRAVVEPSP